MKNLAKNAFSSFRSIRWKFFKQTPSFSPEEYFVSGTFVQNDHSRSSPCLKLTYSLKLSHYLKSILYLDSDVIYVFCDECELIIKFRNFTNPTKTFVHSILTTCPSVFDFTWTTSYPRHQCVKDSKVFPCCYKSPRRWPSNGRIDREAALQEKETKFWRRGRATTAVHQNKLEA